MNSTPLFYILSALFVALQVADAVSTILVLRRGGRELNPLAKWLMGVIGYVAATIAFKVALVAVYLIALFWVAPGYPYRNLVAGLLVALYLYVIFNNVKAYREQNSRSAP